MEALKRLRKILKMNQQQMADELGMSKSLYAKVENGNREASREFMTTIKKKYKFIDTNIFFKE